MIFNDLLTFIRVQNKCYQLVTKICSATPRGIDAGFYTGTFALGKKWKDQIRIFLVILSMYYVHYVIAYIQL